MKKVLILTITAGEGHNSTAKAVQDLLNARGITCKIIDAYRYVSRLLGSTINTGYLFSSKYSPKVYRTGYRMAEKMEHHGFEPKIVSDTQYIISKKLLRHMREEQDDCVVCTHVFAAKMVNAMKLKGYFRGLPTIGIVTDFTIHPFWSEATQIEYLLVASELLANEAERKGISKSRLLPFGIPINSKFSHRREQREARLELGIDPDRYTVLMMGGSMGYGKLDQQIRSLDELPFDFQILAVCGNNQTLKESLDEILLSKPLHVYGFVHNVDVMMDAADCIVTKPGGLTTSEALTKGLPMIIVNPIPGQEERNVEFLMNNQAAVLVSETYPLSDALYQFFVYPQKIDNLRRSIALINKPDADERLADFIEKL